ncbi:SSI family serine proteinase inhibitor [Nonomuraea sp. LPB2021202275-12-8]|uniref:SSI family serine proteinase inhibitor n=1 Tax=Nonomuraea sp. LPB2021202275-12-8 TaxID=3120159 RepID=UPI00300C7EB7
MMKVVAAITLCGAFLVTAAASPALAERAPRSTLRIVVATKDGPTKAATLICGRDARQGGDHPSPRAACRLLRQVDGDPARLNVVPDPVCTRELRPHAVVVAGMWRGRPVSFGHVYGNACLVNAAGGAVFAL